MLAISRWSLEIAVEKVSYSSDSNTFKFKWTHTVLDGAASEHITPNTPGDILQEPRWPSRALEQTT